MVESRVPDAVGQIEIPVRPQSLERRKLFGGKPCAFHIEADGLVIGHRPAASSAAALRQHQAEPTGGGGCTIIAGQKAEKDVLETTKSGRFLLGAKMNPADEASPEGPVVDAGGPDDHG